MWNGEKKKVRLNVDLTRYHRHLVPGVTGTVIPDLKCSMWGSQDRFGAVRFDCCGVTMDIVLANLTFDPAPEVGAPTPAK
jgi:hypothetical protein